MNCPYCQTAQPEPPPRLCVACARAIPGVRPPAWKAAADKPVIRCIECGTVATRRRCGVCAAPVRWPDDLEPPDDDGAPGQGPAPDLVLPPGPDDGQGGQP